MNDEELTAALRAAYVCTDPASPLELDRLAAIVAATPAAPVAPRPRHWRRAVAAFTVATLSVGTGVAYAASGGSLPSPLRRVAHALHLPVDSVELDEARTAQRAYDEALASGDPARIDAAAAALRDRLSRLRPGEGRELRGPAAPPTSADAVPASGATTTSVPAPGAMPSPTPASPTTSIITPPRPAAPPTTKAGDGLGDDDADDTSTTVPAPPPTTETPDPTDPPEVTEPPTVAPAPPEPVTTDPSDNGVISDPPTTVDDQQSSNAGLR